MITSSLRAKTSTIRSPKRKDWSGLPSSILPPLALMRYLHLSLREKYEIGVGFFYGVSIFGRAFPDDVDVEVGGPLFCLPPCALARSAANLPIFIPRFFRFWLPLLLAHLLAVWKDKRPLLKCCLNRHTHERRRRHAKLTRGEGHKARRKFPVHQVMGVQANPAETLSRPVPQDRRGALRRSRLTWVGQTIDPQFSASSWPFTPSVRSAGAPASGGSVRH